MQKRIKARVKPHRRKFLDRHPRIKELLEAVEVAEAGSFIIWGLVTLIAYTHVVELWETFKASHWLV